MTSTYSAFANNEELETQGIVVDYGPAGKFLIARAGGANRKFQRVSEKVFRPYRRQIEAKTIDPKVADKLLAQVFAQTVILGWENVTDRDGNELEFSPENAQKLLLDLPDLFASLREEAVAAANFRADEVEEDLGNSENALTTT